jgi:GNAT superfamily N-acetyltransferase
MEAPRRIASEGRAGTSGRRSFTTKLLSKQTCDDFETLFAVGTGWGRCGCLFALDARRSTRGETWAAQREVNLRAMRGLVEQSRSQGILVYDDGKPVGWCQFVPKDQLRFTDVAESGADWFITCFVVDPRYRGFGATGVALRAALKAIARRGGGVVEGRATAIAPGPPPTPDRKGVYVDDDVLFFGGSAKVRFGVEVDGVGPVAALYRSRRSMHSAPLGGTMDLFRREGFEAVSVVPRAKSALADRIVMRRTV